MFLRSKLFGFGYSVLVCTLLSGCTSEQAPQTLAKFELSNPSLQTLDQVSSSYEIVSRKDGRYEVLVPADQEQSFRDVAPDAQLLEQDIDAELKDLASKDPSYFAGYHSFDEVQQLFATLANEHPEIAKLEPYGTSEGGRPLFALKVSDNVNDDEDEPELMITSGTHGDEIITVEVLVNLVQELINGYGNDARLSAMIDQNELFFVPVVNADGFATRSRYANGVDPNRDYPWPDQPNRNSNACISAIMDFFHAHDIKGSIDLHAYGKMIMYPWAYTSTAPNSSDVQVFSDLGDQMAQGNRYDVGQISRIIYVAKGSSADYYYWKNGSLSYGIEMTTTKAPPSSSIPNVVNECREMIWTFIEHFQS